MVALGILCLIATGIYMVQTEAWPLFHLHKSVGLLLFAVIIARVLWRLKNGLPHPVGRYSRLEHGVAKAVHYLLLACTIAMPISGMIYSGNSGNGFGIFSVEIFPSNYPPEGGMAIPLSTPWADIGQATHSFIGYFLLGLIVLHVAGALKHHIVDRDSTLTRMLGGGAKQQSD